MPDRLQDYLRQVGEQIRWKRARPQLLSELETHLLDQRDDCLSQGMGEEEAQQEAVRQMGDPVDVGQALDAVHRPKPQWGLLVFALAVATEGAILRLWLTSGWAQGGYSVAETLATLCLGAAALVGAYLLDYTWLYRRGRVLSLMALALVWALGVWMQWSPQWYTKLPVGTVVVFCLPLAFLLWALPWRGKKGKGLLAVLLYLAALLLGILSIFQSSGMAFAALSCLGLLLVLGGLDWFGWGRKRTLAVVLVALVLFLAVLGFVLVQYTYSTERDPTGTGYLGAMLQQALQGAQWTGQGAWGSAIPYEQAVPDAGGAYFLVTVATKLGWLMAAAVLVDLSILTTWLLVKCLRQKNQIGRLVALAVLGPMILRLVLGGAAGLLGFPLWASGVPLFFTDGGTVVDLALLGFVLSVFRQQALPVPGAPRPQTQ